MKTDLILCPVDYSHNSSVAFDLVSRIAKPGNKVILLHVSGDGEKPLTLEDAWMQRTESQLRDQILVDNSIDVEHLTQPGNPAEVIVNIAKQKSVDLIVMGTQGRTGLSRLVLGSVAQGVLGSAPCDVITVRPHPILEKAATSLN
jgi:universal stress protein A